MSYQKKSIFEYTAVKPGICRARTRMQNLLQSPLHFLIPLDGFALAVTIEKSNQCEVLISTTEITDIGIYSF